MALKQISIRGAREHNLKGVDLDIPHEKLVVMTGLSGSGKSSLAFDTIYAEGQRKYVESLSAYARQFLEQLQKPDVESIEGLPPTIAIEQRSASHNPRSTVATTTEIYDYLRLLFARAGKPRCWHKESPESIVQSPKSRVQSPKSGTMDSECGHEIASQSATQIVDQVMAMPEGTRLMVLAPIVRGKKGHHKEVFEAMGRQGFVRARVDGEVMDLRTIAQGKEGTPFTTKKQRYQAHTIEAVVDRIVVKREEGAKGPGDQGAEGGGTEETRTFATAQERREDATSRGAKQVLRSGVGEGKSPHPSPLPEGEGVDGGVRTRVADSVELSLKLAEGLVIISAQENQSKSKGSDSRSQSSDLRSQSSDLKWTDTLFSEKYACPLHPECSLEDLEPRLFSFNSPYGACPSCGGLGTIMEFDPDLIVADPNLSLSDGAIDAWRKHGKRMNIYYSRMLRQFCKAFGVDAETPYKKLTKTIQRILMHGTTARDEKKYDAYFEGVIPNVQRRWDKTDSEWVKQRLHHYLSEAPCEMCGGARLRTEALHVFLEAEEEGTKGPRDQGVKGEEGTRAYNVDDVTRMTIEQATVFFGRLRLSHEEAQIAAPILKEITARIGFMMSVGLGYLSLNRPTATLSGGEAQRIRLATQVGSGLVGCCYVLDEPTIGLHQRDNDRLIRTLRHLTDIGNTVLVVEHDEEVIRSADYIVDVGPGPGRHGGHIVAQGTLEEVMAQPASLTGQYMSGKRRIPVPGEGGTKGPRDQGIKGAERRGEGGRGEGEEGRGEGAREIPAPSSLRSSGAARGVGGRRVLDHDRPLLVKGAAEHNLKGIDATFPLGGIVCVTGVSGSGKSTLVNQILLRAVRRQLLGSRDKPGAHDKVLGVEGVDRVIEVDQSPIGRTPRSNPATYTNVFNSVRDLFTKTREAKIRGYKPGRFSFNVKGGRCEACQGQGVKKIEMHFLPDVFVECDVCKGRRYNRETLEIRYRGKSIADVLDMTVEEALAFFDNFPDIKRLLAALNDVGLSYVQLGQASTTLSGGEAQRVKLATELGKRSTGRTLYVLDEPTTGLHFADVEKLLGVLGQLVGERGEGGGNTIVVIEHNMDVIKSADWIIDLGPEGGERGGRIVAQGTPEEVARVEGSYTGQWLRDYLGGMEVAERELEVAGVG